jgi:hypothetical protein
MRPGGISRRELEAFSIRLSIHNRIDRPNKKPNSGTNAALSPGEHTQLKRRVFCSPRHTILGCQLSPSINIAMPHFRRPGVWS